MTSFPDKNLLGSKYEVVKKVKINQRDTFDKFLQNIYQAYSFVGYILSCGQVKRNQSVFNRETKGKLYFKYPQKIREFLSFALIKKYSFLFMSSYKQPPSGMRNFLS